ncbi:unnamed protein product, partial [marine sediment metagenome]
PQSIREQLLLVAEISVRLSRLNLCCPYALQ